LAERNEVNLTAAAAAPTTAESSWLTYVLVLLGGARGGNDGALVPEYARR
jgi:hypothetical protein